MKTIAQQLGVKDFPFEINDKDGRQIYFEDSSGNWKKRKYDSGGNEIQLLCSDGFWVVRNFDIEGKKTYYEDSRGVIERRRQDVFTTNQ